MSGSPTQDHTVSLFVLLRRPKGENNDNIYGRVILVLSECIWNAFVVSLALPAFDDIDSLGFPPCRVVYPPGFTLSDCLPFPYGE